MDTLNRGAEAAAGIPDTGMRTILLVSILFALCILGVVLVGRMKEADEELKP